MTSTFANRARMEAQFNRAHLSRKDFEDAKEFLMAYRQRFSAPIRRALLISAILSYCRPFAASRSGGHEKATAALTGNPQNILSKEEHQLHEKLLALRHEALAHSSFDRRPTGRIPAIGPSFLVQSKMFDVLSERIDLVLFRSICETMMHHCTKKMFELNRHLENGAAKP